MLSNNKVNKTRQCKLPKPDNRGRIRPIVGILANGRKARFTVGDKRTSQVEAQRRLDLIRHLYDKQCERFNKVHWVGWSHGIATAIATRGRLTDTCIGAGINNKQRATDIAQLRAWGVPIEISEPELLHIGMATLRDEIATTFQRMLADQTELRGAVVEALPLPANQLSLSDPTTLHEAIDSFTAHLKTTGKKNAEGHLVTRVTKRSDRLRHLKEHHKDLPLYSLDFPKIDELFSYWRNRPLTKKGNRCSKSYSTDILKEFGRLLRWINSNPSYKWELPRNFDEIKKTLVDLPSDNKSGFQAVTKETYSPEELATICEHTDNFGRLLIALCVNCAFGASEVGQFSTENYVLNQTHPEAKKIGFESLPSDCWAIGNRPKTGCYGQHLLWSKVGEALSPFLDGREVLPITTTRKPWYKTHSTNPSSKFTRWWTDTVKRTIKHHPKFRYLPFGSLRDVLPNILRQEYSAELASLALQHKTPSADKLLECYANLPFAKLFNATRELESRFKPMLDKLSPE